MRFDTPVNRCVLLTVFLLSVIAGTVHAQDAPKVGVTMGYPSSIGVIWQVTGRVAVRPEMTLSRVTGDSSANDLAGAAPLSTDETNGVGTGISALFYLGRWDALRTYVSPRFAYSRNSTSASTANAGSPSTSDSTVSSYVTSGSFGAQYALGRRFGLFGEVGLSYSRTSTSLSSSLATNGTTIVNVHSSSRANAVATRSGVGVIFFF